MSTNNNLLDETLLNQAHHIPVTAFRQNITAWIEMMAAAYLQATDIPPEECQLVVQAIPEENKMIYRFERRPTEEPHV